MGRLLFNHLTAMLILFTGHLPVVLTLLRHGAVWKRGDLQWQRTALHMAAMKGQTRLVNMLLQLDRMQVCIVSYQFTTRIVIPLCAYKLREHNSSSKE